ncbi:MAG: 2-oxo acid dehydrogenase subunit E2 [Anaerolineae bacterium]|jgi:pyruvate dehydrogenase E2 component (dihydrolipoamide acetyltransferase)
MAVDIVVPPLSQTMNTVVLLEWLKDVGDEVEKGEPLLIIETDKASLEIEAPASGVLQSISAAPGDEVEIRSTIGAIDPEAGGAPGAGDAKTAAKPAGRPAPEPAAPTGPRGEPLPEERRSRILASPRARSLAEREGVPLTGLTPTGPQQMIVERDVKATLEEARRGPKAAPSATPVARRLAEHAALDLSAVEGSGRNGQITKRDVEEALAQQGGPPSEGVRWVELSATRDTIACRMRESQQAAAEVTLMRDADCTELVRLREQILEDLSEEDPRPTYTDFLLSIVARGLSEHRNVNAITDGERIGLSRAVHVAVAVDTDRGLLTPVVRDADQKGLLQLAEERAALVTRSLDGSATPQDLSGGTFTITNLGPLGVDAFTPIINPPQIAILGIGRIRPEPAVYQGELCIRQLVSLSLTFDHRFIDGAPAARFLADVVRVIERPHLMWL